MNKELFKQGDDWSFELLEKFDELGKKYIAELGFDHYPLQIEVITAEQMIGLYSSGAMPMHYNHWSLGKSYIRDYQNYYNGKSGLAYEICLNSDPCICYCMEDNDALMMASVIWHVYGHSSHFKSNYLKRDGDAENIVTYMENARDYIANCEDKYGVEAVESILDMAHSVQWNSINKYKRTKGISQDERNAILEQAINETRSWYSQPETDQPHYDDEDNVIDGYTTLPEENILYFVEKNSKVLTRWQKNILKIVRNLAQYSYSSLSQTSVMAEGTAMFVECYMMERAHEEGYISDGSYLQYLNANGGVFWQLQIGQYKERAFDVLMEHGKFNPYFLGYQMYKDIQRMCEAPTDEDRQFRPEICGQDYKLVLKDVIANYRDESFIRQFLSPHLIKKLKIMSVEYDTDKDEEEQLLVLAHHEERYYQKLRDDLADEYLIGEMFPNIYIEAIDKHKAYLKYEIVHGRLLNMSDAILVCNNISKMLDLTIELIDSDNYIVCSVKHDEELVYTDYEGL